MKRLFRFLKRYRKEAIIGPIFKLTEAIFELIIPLVMIKIIDVGIANSDVNYVIKMGVVMILLGLVGLGCSLTCQYCAARASQGFGTDVRNALFRHINSLSHAEVDKFGTPSLITRLNNDVNQLQVGVAMLIRLVIRSPFLVIGAIIMAMTIDLKLSLVFVVATPFIALILYFVMSRSVPFFKKIQKGLDRVSLITRENLTGVRVIRAFSTQKKEAQRFAETTQDLTDFAMGVGKLSALLNPMTSVIVNLAIIAIVWFGAFQVNIGTLTQGEIVAFVNYLTQILIALIAVANLVVIFTKAFASAGRVDEVFAVSPSVVQTETPVADNKTTNAPFLRFDNVSFSYDTADEMALSEISFTLNRGETLGIIGGTGAGKSTLVNLIPRFYNTVSGDIYLNGINVKEYPFAQLRKQIGMVPQKAVLFSGTLRDNLKWGNKDATDQEIAAALKTAQASDFVEKLSDGYDTLIMQGGKNLSGGQKQRLTIARALVRKPELLILDDSASALDFATDSALRKAIRQDVQGTTVILVSQRVNNVKLADRILCLADGTIAGIGTHEELFTSCDEYREICYTQLSEDEIHA